MARTTAPASHFATALFDAAASTQRHGELAELDQRPGHLGVVVAVDRDVEDVEQELTWAGRLPGHGDFRYRDLRVQVVSRSRIKNFKPSARASRFISRLRACWVTHSPVGWAVIAAKCTRRVPCSMKTARTGGAGTRYRRGRNRTRASSGPGCAGTAARGAGPPAARGVIRSLFSTLRTVEAPTGYPSPSSSPWIRR